MSLDNTGLLYIWTVSSLDGGASETITSKDETNNVVSANLCSLKPTKSV